MSVPAGMVIVKAAKPAEQQAERVAGALYRAATTPIISRHTVKEVQDEDGNPKLVDQQVNISALSVVAGALGMFILGLGLKPQIETVNVVKKVPNPAYVEWQRTGVNADTGIPGMALRGANAGIAVGFGNAPTRDPAPSQFIEVNMGTKPVRRFRWAERPRGILHRGANDSTPGGTLPIGQGGLLEGGALGTWDFLAKLPFGPGRGLQPP